MGNSPVTLCDCDDVVLCAEPEETITFRKIVLLKPENKKGERPRPGIALPGGYLVRHNELARRNVSTAAAAAAIRVVEKLPLEKQPKPDKLGPWAKLEVSDRMHKKLSNALAHRGVDQSRITSTGGRVVRIESRKGGIGALSHGPMPNIFQDIVDEVREAVQLAVGVNGTSRWAVGVTYRQTWRSQGFRKYLVKIVPLTPGETREVSVKTWEKLTGKTSDSLTQEAALSQELLTQRKWSLATKGVLTNETNASLNPSGGLKGDVSVPLDAVKIGGGGNLGLSGTLSDKLANTSEIGLEQVVDSTSKAVASLKSIRVNQVETAFDRGFETTEKQTISNTNRCHSLNYHYFELLETYEVETVVESVVPLLLVPLELSELSVEWVLCHECELRQALLCRELVAGFDAAKTLAVAAAMAASVSVAASQTGANTSSGSTGGSSDGFDGAVQNVLAAYRRIKNAELTPGHSDDPTFLDVLADTGRDIAEGIADWGSEVASDAEAAGTELVNTITDGLNAVGDAAGGFIESAGNFFGVRALSLGNGPGVTGGVGSYIYREVSDIVMPQIMQALAFLDQAWPATQAMSGEQRASAEVSVLATFFGKLGDPASTFGTLDGFFATFTALAIGGAGLAGMVTGGVIGGVIGGVALSETVVGVPGGAAIGAIAGGAVGAAVGVAAMSALIGLIAVLEPLGLADTVPDDEGLRPACEALKAMFDAGLTLGAGAPGSGPGAGAAGANALVLLDAQRQQAEALVEFERLKCHLSRNLPYYMQTIWSRLPDYAVLELLQKAGVPTEMVSSQFVQFFGAFGAVEVTDLKWLHDEGGIDWRAIKEETLSRIRARRFTIEVPTPNVIVEPRLGECEGCEEYIEQSRANDLALKSAEVELAVAKARMAAAEADRYEARVAANELDDPTPNEPGGI